MELVVWVCCVAYWAKVCSLAASWAVVVDVVVLAVLLAVVCKSLECGRSSLGSSLASSFPFAFALAFAFSFALALLSCVEVVAWGVPVVLPRFPLAFVFAFPGFLALVVVVVILGLAVALAKSKFVAPEEVVVADDLQGVCEGLLVLGHAYYFSPCLSFSDHDSSEGRRRLPFHDSVAEQEGLVV